MRLFLLFICVVCFFQSKSQNFEDFTSEANIEHSWLPGEYGAGVSFVDINHDGFDDLTLLKNNQDIEVHFGNENGFDQDILSIPNTEEPKSVTWIDFDNDGDFDLFVQKHLAQNRFYENIGDLELVDITFEAGFPNTELHRGFGHSWTDYDNDGFIDVYVCNYNSFEISNYLYHNNGDGTFSDVTLEMGVDDNFHYSFVGLWIDLNFDGWQDLFLINDRQNCSNRVYMNLEGEGFDDRTNDAGVNHFIFSMNCTTSDYDLDGDFDVYISNNPEGNLFLENQGINDENFVEFMDVAINNGTVVYDMSWSAQFIDFDLDGDEDLHVSNSPFWGEPGQNKFLINNGLGSFFTDMTVGFENDEGFSHSSAVGDFDNDGDFDLFNSNDYPTLSRIYRSNPGDNKSIKVTCNGVISNRDGIGTYIELYVNGQKYIRQTQCGEGYLTQNSRSEIFGIGSAEYADSLILHWPSGHIDHFYDIEGNSMLTITEGSSLSAELLSDGDIYICPGEVVTLTAPGFDSVLWSDGSESATLEVTSGGTYSYTYTTDLGLTVESNELSFLDAVEVELSTMGSDPLCYNDSSGFVTFESSNDWIITDVYWNGELGGDTLFNLNSGVQELLIETAEGCSFTSSVAVENPFELLSSVVQSSDVLCFGENSGTVDLSFSGGTGELFVFWNGINPEALYAGEYDVTVQDENGCVSHVSFMIEEPEELSFTFEVIDADNGNNGVVSAEIEGGVEPYVIEVTDGEDNFELDELSQGEYTITITDDNDCSISDTFSITDVGIDSGIIYSQWNLFPNPNNGEFVLVAPDHQEISNIKIFSVYGTEVYSAKNFSHSRVEIKTSGIALGHYVLVAYNNEGRMLKQLTFAVD